jgi:hypothetical protein
MKSTFRLLELLDLNMTVIDGNLIAATAEG